jgi:hypothetical protein
VYYVLLSSTEQVLGHVAKNRRFLAPSGLDIRVETRQAPIDQVRVVPRTTRYTVEVFYEQSITPADVDAAWVAGIHPGVNNLAVITSNQSGYVPPLVNGRLHKALNQLYYKDSRP